MAIHTICFDCPQDLKGIPLSALKMICGLKRIQVKFQQGSEIPKDREDITKRLIKVFPKSPFNLFA
jgi:hypothetical protein